MKGQTLVFVAIRSILAILYLFRVSFDDSRPVEGASQGLRRCREEKGALKTRRIKERSVIVTTQPVYGTALPDLCTLPSTPACRPACCGFSLSSAHFSRCSAQFFSMATKRLRGVSVYRPIIYGNTAVLLDASERGENDHTHRWTVGVRSATSPAVPTKNQASQIGGADDIR